MKNFNQGIYLTYLLPATSRTLNLWSCPILSGKKLIWLSLRNNKPIFSQLQISSGMKLSRLRSAFKLVKSLKLPSEEGSSDSKFSVSTSSVSWLHWPTAGVRTTSWFCSSFKIFKLASCPIVDGKNSMLFIAKFMSVSDTQPWISSGSVSSMFSLTSRNCKRLRWPISRGTFLIWLRSSQRTFKFCSLPISGGISSISLLPRSSVSSLAMLHNDSGIDLSRLSRPCNERRLTRLEKREF